MIKIYSIIFKYNYLKNLIFTVNKMNNDEFDISDAELMVSY